MIKSTLKEIKERFDQDVERFSSLETGQSTMMNSGLVLDLFEAFAQETGVENPRVLDLGCGGGNLSLRLNRALPGGTYRLVDLSLKMLERAQERIVKAGGRVEDIYQGDLEAYTWPQATFHFVTASAVLHHLRSREAWRRVLGQVHDSLKIGGHLFFWDYIREEQPILQRLQQERFRSYLTDLRDEAYAQHVFDYAEKEDSPETLPFILSALQETGFQRVDVVHKNALFGGIIAQK